MHIVEDSSEHQLIQRLYGGNSMSIGQAPLIATEVLLQPKLFPHIFEGLWHPVPLVRMRAAYTVSKIAKQNPALLQPYKISLIDCLTAIDNSHLAKACMLQALSSLQLDTNDSNLLSDLLLDFMHSSSSIVKTLSLEILVNFAVQDHLLWPKAMPVLWNALDHGTPAMRARARKLIKKYKL